MKTVLLAAVIVCTVAIVPATPTHLVYEYRTAAAMNARGNFGPAEAAFDKASAGGNAALAATQYDGHEHTGRIALELLQRAGNGTAVFNVSEDGKKQYRCAVTGESNTVICDVDAHFGNAVMLLLRVIGPEFYSAARLDAARHWRVSSADSGISENADYSVVTNTGGSSLTIAMERHGEQVSPAPLQVDARGKIAYDTVRAIPTAMDVLFTVGPPQAPGAAEPVAMRIELHLVNAGS